MLRPSCFGLLLGLLMWPAAASSQFREQILADDLPGGYQVVAADLNRDGRPDLIVVASGLKELIWLENPTWQRHVIAGNLSRLINAAAADIDGDGIPEIALAHEFSNEAKNSPGVISLLHHDGDPRRPWTITEIDRLPTSHRLKWADLEGRGMKVLVNAPLTGAAATAPLYQDSTPLVYYRPGEWKRRLITDQNRGVVHGLTILDWDGDRRDEILTASFLGLHLHQLTKQGIWTRLELAKGDPAPAPRGGASDVAVGQLRNQKFLATIEPWHGGQVAVYFWREGRWDRQLIDESLVDGHTILTADFDADGQDEIVAGMRGAGHQVYLYKASDRTGRHWTRTALTAGRMAAANCLTVDLDADRRLDLVCIGSATHNLLWYQNLGPISK